MAVLLYSWYFYAVAIPGLLLSLSTILRKWSSTAKGNRRFPGPQQFPLVGRVHDLPRMTLWLKFKEWADMYGSIYETSMMGLRFIVVTDESIAQELLIKKGNSFSGRTQIRALLDHRDGPVYVALQDRHGTSTRQHQPPCARCR
ncbi:hypothetical protein NLG97_g11161 [Lecanicillium saksenae]|uniref:Uncharacterized protein n=1 Tax=Lecanicillium saksenae TaxID=468837 RepID=A0ACC1QCV5_9HYPO|nr:hypothetical protein NLG97_g11161 [Lecanicillium saksenae]